MKDNDKKILEAVIQKHSPWIQKAIKHLRGMGKIGSQFEDGDFYNTGYNAIAEALSSFDKEKGSKTGKIKNLPPYTNRGYDVYDVCVNKLDDRFVCEKLRERAVQGFSLHKLASDMQRIYERITV